MFGILKYNDFEFDDQEYKAIRIGKKKRYCPMQDIIPLITYRVLNKCSCTLHFNETLAIFFLVSRKGFQ